MFLDAHSISAGSTIEVDVCIIGAGAAGIAVALKFAGTGARVFLVESGSLEGDADTSLLNDGASVGLPYYPLAAARLRYFGGTTNHWGGWCSPATAWEFQRREWLPLSGWPIEHASLRPHFEEAHRICDLGPYDYDPGRWSAGGPPIPPQLNTDRVVPTVTQFSAPTRFGEKFRAQLEKAPDVTVVLGANALRLRARSKEAAVDAVLLGTLDGHRFTLRSRFFVLCAGGIENPRILLNSNERWRDGMGNPHDNVGRYFADHYSPFAGEFWPKDPRLDLGFFAHHPTASVPIKGYLRLTEAQQAKHRVGVARVAFTPVFDPFYDRAAHSAGAESLQYLLQMASKQRRPDDLGSHLLNILRDLDEVAIATYRKLRYKRFPVEHYAVDIGIDPIPERSSRVTLGEDVDAVGARKIVLDWRINEGDRHTFEASRRLLAEEIGRQDIGRFKLKDYEGKPWPPIENGILAGGFHHMGTTRMSTDPKTGVVNPDCRVHGLSNLYVGGSSVFPSYEGQPTLLIVALALRLAAHLRARLELA